MPTCLVYACVACVHGENRTTLHYLSWFMCSISTVAQVSSIDIQVFLRW